MGRDDRPDPPTSPCLTRSKSCHRPKLKLTTRPAWYEEKKLGLGFELLDRVDEAIAKIRDNPFRYSLRFGDVRRAPVRRFKFYGVYYFVEREDVVIISVFNDRQDPDRLRERRAQLH